MVIYKIKKRLRRIFKRVTLLITILSHSKPLKIILGGGNTNYTGWINTDYPIFNITLSAHWYLYFLFRKADFFLAEHVLEHLTYEEVRKTLKLSNQFLKFGGSFRVAVPDGFNPSNEYIDAVKPGGWEEGADDHKILWNYERLSEVAKEVGFQITLLEYYNENGKFICRSFNNKEGYIIRSKNNNYLDKNVPNYSSLIVDFFK